MLVRSGTVVAVPREGVLGCGGGVAWDLLEGITEVRVGGLGKPIVDGCDVGVICVVWIVWDGIGDVGTEGEVVDNLTIVVCRRGV